MEYRSKRSTTPPLKRNRKETENTVTLTENWKLVNKTVHIILTINLIAILVTVGHFHLNLSEDLVLSKFTKIRICCLAHDRGIINLTGNA